ncbi:MAG: HAD family phosphatase [Clostridia bacterium]|nr:HAD family phosphatase [Clostridia bacterium]
MITTVIFDYGNTLVRFCEKELAALYTDTPEDAQLIETVFFDRYYWSRLDEGTLSHKNWIADAAKRLPPHLHPTLQTIADTWYYRLPAIDGMEALVKKLHRRGTKLYLLSNISKAFSERIGEFPLFSLFDGIICSADYRVTKPDTRLYKILLDTYALTAEECLFIDDRADNIEAAERLGIHGYLFDGDAKTLAQYLDTPV